MHDCRVKKILGPLIILALLSACGGNEEVITSTTQGNTTTVPQQIEVTDTSGPTTTVPLISKSALPKLVDCPTRQISKETGETFREIIRCVDGWAVGIPQRYVDKFNGDTNVEAEWVLTNTPGKWTVVGVCHMYHPIFEGSMCNDPYDDDPVNWSLIPPMPVQCVLWDGARFKESIAETGCPNSF
jgi:hypothetical protein